MADLPAALRPSPLAGLLALAAGFVCVAVGAVDVEELFTVSRDPRGHSTMPVVLLLTGIILLLFGGWSIRAGRSKVVMHMRRVELRAELERRELPFWVCLRCHHFMPSCPINACIECDSTVDCLEVASERDRTSALVAMGS
ncbi:MAG: hypothetical protein IAG13_32390 [Deltaproteobacteria bacterium]|nr:hypothetical protein [Nannocystaceae bacterium]